MKKFSVEQGAVCLFTDRLTRKYFCGADVAEGYLFLGDEKIVYTDARYFSAAKVLLEQCGVPCRLYKDATDLKNYLCDKNIQTLYIDFSKTTVKEYFELQSFGAAVKDCSEKLERFKAQKTQKEIINIEKACSIVQKAYYSAIKTVRKGMTEIELKDTLERFMLQFGAEKPSFETIVAFGFNAAVPHHETGNTILQDNMVILIDAGCVCNGYCSDLTRTAFFGTPDKKFLDCYKAVKQSNELAIDGIRSGISARQADAIAREHLAQLGLDKYFTHSLGHGVGQEIHEYPRLSPKSDAILEENMVFTIEPGVYLDGEFGIRIEDTVVIENGKVKRLFTDDKNLLILKNL